MADLPPNLPIFPPDPPDPPAPSAAQPKLPYIEAGGSGTEKQDKGKRESGLTPADSLTILLFLGSILMWIFIPTVSARLVAIFVAAGGGVYLSCKGHWTRNFSDR